MASIIKIKRSLSQVAPLVFESNGSGILESDGGGNLLITSTKLQPGEIAYSYGDIGSPEGKEFISAIYNNREYTDLNYTYEGSGHDATFKVVKTATEYTLIRLATGLDYNNGESIVISGDQLDGVTPDNDITINITTTSSEGGLLGFTYSGIPTGTTQYNHKVFYIGVEGADANGYAKKVAKIGGEFYTWKMDTEKGITESRKFLLIGDSRNTDYLKLNTLVVDSAYISQFEADQAHIRLLNVDSAEIVYLSADQAYINTLTAESAGITYLRVDSAFINTLNVIGLNLDSGFVDTLNVIGLNVDSAFVDTLNVVGLNVDSAFIDTLNVVGANIDSAFVDTLNVVGLNVDSGFVDVLNVVGLNVDSAYVDTLNAVGANIDSAFIDTLNVVGANIDSAFVDTLNVVGLNVDSGFIDTLSVIGANIDSAFIDTLNVVGANIDSAFVDTLNVVGANIDSAYVDQLNVKELDVNHAHIKVADIDSANITELDAVNARIETLYTGHINGPEAIIIDPSAIGDNTGRVIIKGDLQIDGETTTVNSTTVTINDKNILLADSAADSYYADGAGITIGGANANITYVADGDKFVINKVIETPGITADSGRIVNLSSDSARITNISGEDLTYDVGYFNDLTAKKLTISGNLPYTLTINDSQGQLTSDTKLAFDGSEFVVDAATTIKSTLSVDSGLYLSDLTPNVITIISNDHKVSGDEDFMFGSKTSEYGTFTGLNVGFERLYDSGYYRFSVNKNTGDVSAKSITVGAHSQRPVGQFNPTYPDSGILDFYGLIVKDREIVSTAVYNKFQTDITKEDALLLDSFSQEANIIQVKALDDTSVFEVKKDGSINFMGALLQNNLPFEAGGVFKKATTGNVYYTAKPTDLDIFGGGGNVGINTQTPKHQLEIQDGELFIEDSLNSTTWPQLQNLGYNYKSKTSKFLFFPQRAVTRAGWWDNSTTYFNNFTFGSYSTAFGRNVVATGISSIAMGDSSWAVDDYTVAIGKNNNTGTNNDRTVLIGTDNVVSANSGNYINILGNNNTNAGDEVVIVGRGNDVSTTGDRSHVFGRYNTSTGIQNYVIGEYNLVEGDNSKVIGRNNIVNPAGASVTLIGDNNYGDGTYSAVIGSNSRVTGDGSYVFGNDAKVSGNYSIAVSVSAASQKPTIDSDNVFAVLGGGVLINPTSDSYQIGNNALVVVGDILYTGQFRQAVEGGGTVSGNIFVDDGTDVTYTEGKNIGIHVERPYHRVQTAGSFAIREENPGSIFIPSDPNADQILDSSADGFKQMLFHPASAAFRLGTIQYLSNDSVGIQSIGMGFEPIAGNYSVAIGQSVISWGEYTYGIGKTISSSGNNNLNIGHTINNNGIYNYNFGYNIAVDGQYNATFGLNNTISSDNNVIVGADNTVSNTNNTVVGVNLTVNSITSTILGRNTTAVGTSNTILGNNNSIDGTSNTGLGNNLSVNGTDNTGLGNNLSVNGSKVIAIGNAGNIGTNTANTIVLNPETTNYSVDSGNNAIIIPGTNTTVSIAKTRNGLYSLDIGGDVNLDGLIYINDQLAGIFEYDSDNARFIDPAGLIVNGNLTVDVYADDGVTNIYVDSTGLNVDGDLIVQNKLLLDETSLNITNGLSLNIESNGDIYIKEGNLTLGNGNATINGDIIANNIGTTNLIVDSTTHLQDVFVKNIPLDSYIAALIKLNLGAESSIHVKNITIDSATYLNEVFIRGITLDSYLIASINGTLDASLAPDSVITGISDILKDINEVNPLLITMSETHTMTPAYKWQVLFADVGGMTELNGNTYFADINNTTSFYLYSDSSFTDSYKVTGATFGDYTTGGDVIYFPYTPPAQQDNSLLEALLSVIDSSYVQARVSIDNFWSYTPQLGTPTGFIFNPTVPVPVGIFTNTPDLNYALDVNGAVRVGDLTIGEDPLGTWIENNPLHTRKVIDAAYINGLIAITESTIANYIDSSYIMGIIDSSYILERSKDSSFWQRTENTLYFGTYPNVYNVDVGIGTASPEAKLHVTGTGKFDSDVYTGPLNVNGPLNVASYDITTDSTYYYSFNATDLSNLHSTSFSSGDIKAVYDLIDSTDTDYLLYLGFNVTNTKYLDVYRIDTLGDSHVMVRGDSAGALGVSADFIITGPFSNFIRISTTSTDSNDQLISFSEFGLPNNKLVLRDSDNNDLVLDYLTQYVKVTILDNTNTIKTVLKSSDFTANNSSTLTINDSAYLAIGDIIKIEDRSPKLTSYTNLVGPLTQEGDVDVTGALTVTDSITSGGGLTVAGHGIFGGIGSFGGSLSVGGDSLTVVGSGSFGGSLDIGGSLSVGGDSLTVVGSASLGGSLTVGGNESIGGSLIVNGSLTVNGDSLNVAGNASLGGSLTVGGDVTLDPSAIFYYGPAIATGESDGEGNEIYHRLSFDSNIERIVDSDFIGERFQTPWNVTAKGQQIYYDEGGAVIIGSPADVAENDSATKFLVASGNAIFTHRTDPDSDLNNLTTNVVPNYGAGSRMMWIPQRGAFRVGSVEVGGDTTIWDEARVGLKSYAFGVNAEAGHYSVAIGNDISAGTTTVPNSIASVTVGLGIANQSSLSLAVGVNIAHNKTSAEITSIGREILNPHSKNVAIGDSINISYLNAENVGIGKQIVVSGSSSGVGVGKKVTASNGSVGVGRDISVSGTGVAIGNDAIAAYGVAVGKNADATTYNAVSVGLNSKAGGNSAVAVGNTAIASGPSSVSVGLSNTVSSSTSVAVGKSNVVNGTSGGVSLGLSNTVSSNAFAAGVSNNATNGAIVLGKSNYGYSALVVGSANNITNGSGSIAVGWGNTGNTGISIFGKYNTANRSGVVIGHNNTNNDGSYVFGYANNSNYRSYVFGQANNSSYVSRVFGYNNVSINSSDVFGKDNQNVTTTSIFGKSNKDISRINVYGNYNTGSTAVVSDYGYIFGNSSIVTNTGFSVGTRNDVRDGGFAFGTKSVITQGGFTFGDNNAITRGGFAFGKDNVLTGNLTTTPIALGYSNIGTDNGIAIGGLNTVSSTGLAIGYNNTASGLKSLAIGNYVKATGNNSIAIGLSAVDVGDSVAANNTLAILGGQVGIGLNNPYALYQMEIANNVNVRSGDYYHHGKRLYNYILDDVANKNWIRTNADSNYIHTAIGFNYIHDLMYAQYFFHHDNNTNDLYYIGGGNVGIHTPSPQYDLDVNGDINFNGKLYLSGVEIVPSVDSVNDVAIGINYYNSYYYVDSITTVEEFIDSAYVQQRQAYFDYETVINANYVNSRVDFSFLPDSFYIDSMISLAMEDVAFKVDLLNQTKFMNTGPTAPFLGTRVGIGYDPASPLPLSKGPGLDVMNGGVYIENGNLELTNGQIIIDGEIFEPVSPFVNDGTQVTYATIDPNEQLNVGIGLFNPRHLLHVAGNINIDDGFDFKINDRNLLHEILDSDYINSKLDKTQFLDSGEVLFLIDSTYVYNFTDSSYIKGFIDSAYILNIADSDWVKSIADSNWIKSITDSAYIESIIDSAYILNIADSDWIKSIADSDWIKSIADSSYVKSIADSDWIKSIADSSYVKSIADSDWIKSIADSAYILNIADSNWVKSIADSSYVKSIADSNWIKSIIDSAHVKGIADSDWIKSIADSAHVKTIANATYIRNIANENYIKGYVDSDYINLLTGIGTRNIDFGNHKITYANLYTNVAAMPAASNVPGMVAYGNTTKAPYVADNGQWVKLAREGTNVTFNRVETTDGLIVAGDLQVNGTTTTINSVSMEVQDNMIYLNGANSDGSATTFVDLGFAGNVNDRGSYEHVGFFRDATDGIWKIFEGYTPEPDAAPQINTGHASFSLATLQVGSLIADNLSRDTTVQAGTYGSASLIPVIKVDSSGFIDSIGTVTVAGVTDFVFDSSTGTLTISTADGNSFATVTTLDPFTTDTLAEGVNNVYYTDDRVQTKLGSISGNIIPDTNEAYDLGSSTLRFRDLYLSGTTLYMGTLSVSDETGTLAVRNTSNDIVAINLDANTTDDLTEGVTNLYYTDARVQDVILTMVDSAYVENRFDHIRLIDSAYVMARYTPTGVDSTAVTNLIDSAYVNARVSTVDSAQVLAIVDSTYIKSIALDSNAIITLIDSAYVNSRIDASMGMFLANKLIYKTYYYVGTNGTTVISGSDNNGDTLEYAVGTIQVFVNGINLLNGVDYTANDGSTVEFTAPLQGNEDIFISALRITGEVSFGFKEFTYTADSDQTVFTGADDNGITLSYLVGNLFVTLNGIKLINGVDFLATDGKTITLGAAAGFEDVIGITTAYVQDGNVDSNTITDFGNIEVASLNNLSGTYNNTVNGTIADSNGQVIIDTFVHNNTFTSVEYLVHMEDSINGHTQISKLLATYNKTTLVSTEYGIVNTYTNDSDMGTLSVENTATNIVLKLEKSIGTGSINAKVVKTIIS